MRAFVEVSLFGMTLLMCALFAWGVLTVAVRDTTSLLVLALSVSLAFFWAIEGSSWIFGKVSNSTQVVRWLQRARILSFIAPIGVAVALLSN